MKKYVVMLLLLVINFVTAQECAENIVGPYVSLSSGGLFECCNYGHSRINPGYYVGGSAGYKFCNSIRLEGEFSFQSYRWRPATLYYSKVKDSVNVYTYMVNVYYDFDFLNFCLKPYLGMGIGYADTQWKAHKVCIYPSNYRPDFDAYIIRKSFKEHFDGLAWQAIAGIKYPICDNLDLGLEYRYFQENGIKNNKVGLVLSRFF